MLLDLFAVNLGNEKNDNYKDNKFTNLCRDCMLETVVSNIVINELEITEILYPNNVTEIFEQLSSNWSCKPVLKVTFTLQRNEPHTSVALRVSV